jgi:4'-phosphopantetheinyl transferase
MLEGIDIWSAALDEPNRPGSEELPPRERERAAALRRPEVARRWVAARWALRRVLGRYLALPAAEIELEVGEHGKPRLRDGRGLHFNLSHSEGLALVAVADREIGVDVEAMKPNRDLAALAARALPEEEAASVRSAPPMQRPEIFYRAWTRNEACVKCLGTGLRAPAPAARPAVAALDVGPGYAAAVAVADSEIGPLQLRPLRGAE